MDSNGSPFGSMPNLMAVAEFVTKLHAICSKSGNIAQFTFRKVEDDNLIAVGEKEKYEALSRKVFYNLMKEKN
jgi:thymidine kinase